MSETCKQRILNSVRVVMPSALRTAWWMIRITVIISFGVEVLRYFGIINFISQVLSPVFKLVGLPGEAALAWITGYFVNVYSAVAVMTSLHLDVRSATILAVMVLCAHNMIVETAVQKKTGTSFWRITAVRTLSAAILGFTLNLIMPESTENVMPAVADTAFGLPVLELLHEWFLRTGKLILQMTAIIIVLSIVQRLLAEFGVIRFISKLLKPLLYILGLPGKTSFLWIVANFLGLAYGAAIMIEEAERGKISKHDADLLNHHIGISHSNVEDLLLLYASGGLFWWMLLPRIGWAVILVWERRLEWWIKQKYRYVH
ncbi:MAG: nucleoside recognition domain-containing protein [Cytophagaceae bacterium]|jgi:spore maturation protein SpmB|nr:nucleoside recognition domain-containing protein [Cytophagaceae bacterium]